jgi:hypothetical protein
VKCGVSHEKRDLLALRGGGYRCVQPCYVPQDDDWEDDETQHGYARHTARLDRLDYAGTTAEAVAASRAASRGDL